MKYGVATCLFFALMCLLGCGEDRTYEYMELTQENHWVMEKMQYVYLWNDSMKVPKRQDFFAKSSRFFESILFRNDKYSHFSDSAISTGYGINYAVMRDPLGVQKSKIYALVLFVEPGSPAADAGLKRGDWVVKVGNYTLTSNNYGYLDRGSATTLCTTKIVFDEENMKYKWQNGDTLQMGVATTLSPRNLYIDTVYVQRNHKIGYMACNAFAVDGEGEIAAAMERFANKGITDLIVDLRYNGGGSISAASQMASMIVPAENVGGFFCKLAHNTLNSGRDVTYKFVQAPTLSFDKLYVICGAGTRGAAEVFIAAMRECLGYNSVVVVGATTAGENIATETFVSPYDFSITPATAFVKNSEDEAMCSGGIIPNFAMNELSDIYKIYNLGSMQEYMLYNTIYYIVNGSFPQNALSKVGDVESWSIPARKSISR
jgi:C-terminal processing protease CtpA/Prc